VGDDGWEATSPVGSFPDGRSPFGALDMAGNVWEWCADAFDYYPDRDLTDPPPVVGEGAVSHVRRGGSWSSTEAADARGANRDDGAKAPNTNGFRVALSN
jgi:formylglycine-generating enzyme required for sulfatase activity